MILIEENFQQNFWNFQQNLHACFKLKLLLILERKYSWFSNNNSWFKNKSIIQKKNDQV